MKRKPGIDPLEPCPCCGGKAELKEVRTYMQEGWRVSCSVCRLQTRAEFIGWPRLTDGRVDENTLYTSAQAASIVARLWNRRAADGAFEPIAGEHAVTKGIPLSLRHDLYYRTIGAELRLLARAVDIDHACSLINEFLDRRGQSPYYFLKVNTEDGLKILYGSHHAYFLWADIPVDKRRENKP